MRDTPETKERSTLHVDLHVGDQVQAGDLVVRLEHKKGRAARVQVDAPRGMKIEVKKSAMG